MGTDFLRFIDDIVRTKMCDECHGARYVYAIHPDTKRPVGEFPPNWNVKESNAVPVGKLYTIACFKCNPLMQYDRGHHV